MNKRLVILATARAIDTHSYWEEILHRFGKSWEYLVYEITRPLLDDISRNGFIVLDDGSLTESGYLGELAYDILHELLTGEPISQDGREDPSYPPEPYRDSYHQLFGQLMGIAFTITHAVCQNLKWLRNEMEAAGKQPGAIVFERLIDRDTAVAVYEQSY